ncbi:MAG: NADH-quinone oxidoreductase subunit NuoN, partial [Pseudomonadota bacterium]
MTISQLNLQTVAPEIALLLLLSVVMLVDLFGRERARSLGHLLSVGGLILIAAWQLSEAFLIVPTIGMNGLVVADPMGAALKGGASLATAITLIYARETLVNQPMGFGEFHLFALFALLGGFVMISANHLLTIYLGIELLSLSLYAAVALRRDSAVSTEAAMKYFVLGALASGFLLYGMSMLYGATGSLEIPTIQDKLASGSADRLVMVFGTVFLVAGLAFKLGVVPFHMWVPDVYQGAPTATTLLIGAAPKFAAFAVVIRLLVSGLIGVAVDWQQMLLVLCVLSLIVGNVVAIAQTSLKRVLAYSTIAHMGFMLLALASGVLEVPTGSAAAGTQAVEQAGGGAMGLAVQAYAASMFYVVTYALTALGSFGVILLASSKGFDLDRLDDFKGLGRSRPVLAWAMLILVFSLAGIPPTVGFYAKLVVLESVISAGYIWLAVLAVLASLIGAFFYLRIVKVMFFDEPETSN